MVILARENHSPSITAKDLANELGVSPSFITDIEKGRRLPSLKNQNKISSILKSAAFPAELFDDVAAENSDNKCVVAADLADAIRNNASLRQLIRKIVNDNIPVDSVMNILDKTRKG